MPNVLTTTQLQSYINQLNSTAPGSANFQSTVSGVYSQLASQGYGYANLAKDLVTCSSLSGNVAQNFMSNYATSQGAPLSQTKVQAIELGMAKGYLQTLSDMAINNQTNQVSSDITYKQASDFHGAVFKANNIQPNAWTLYDPGQVLDKATMENVWKQIISPDAATSDMGSARLYAAMNYIGGNFGFANPGIQAFSTEGAVAYNWVSNVTQAGLTSVFSGSNACSTGSTTLYDEYGRPLNELIGGLNGDGTYLIASSNQNYVIYGTNASLSANNAVISMADGSTATIVGNGNGLTIGTKVSLAVNGSADIVTATGAGDIVTIGGNGQSGVLDAVNFQNNGLGGTLNVIDNSHVDGVGTNIRMFDGNNDISGMYGANNYATVTGLNTTFFVGGNGQGGVLDAVNFQNNGLGGTLNVIDNSHVDGVGTNIRMFDGNNDISGMYGANNYATVTGLNTTFFVGGNGQGGVLDAVNFQNNGLGGTLNVIDNSHVDGVGTNIRMFDGNNDISGMYGANNYATVTGLNTTFFVGGNGQGGVLDAVNFQNNGLGGTLNVIDNSHVDGVGTNIRMYGGNNDSLELSGSKDIVQAGTNAIIYVDSNSTGDKINASYAHINAGTNDVIDVHGNGDIETSGSGTKILEYGTGSTDNGVAVGYGQESLTSSNGASISVSATPFSDATIFGEINTSSCTTGHYESQSIGCPIIGCDVWGDPVYSSTPEYISVYVSDPVIINLTGRPVQTQSLQDSLAQFDMSNSGIKSQTGWATAGEGILVYDPQGNNRPITSDSQLVAGYSVLHEMDSDKNGVLNQQDAAWADLKVWIDSTGTASFNARDLYTMDQLGISSINLDTVQTGRVDHGNIVLDDGQFTWSDGRLGDISGVNLLSLPFSAQQAAAGIAAHPLDTSANSLIQAMNSFASNSDVGLISSALSAQSNVMMPQLVNPH